MREIEYRRACGRAAIDPVLRTEFRTSASGAIATIVGHAAVFNQETRIGGRLGKFIEVIRPGAFAETLKENHDILALVEHDEGRLLGRTKSGTLRLSEDKTGLAFTLDIPNTTDGNDVLALAKRGDLFGMSIGFNAAPGGERWSVNSAGETVRELSTIILYHISIVGVAAYEGAQIERVDARSRTASQRQRPAPVPPRKPVNGGASKESILAAHLWRWRNIN